MKLGFLLPAALAASCGAHIAAGGESLTSDAAMTSDAAEVPACSGSLYLNFEGQTLQRGPSDATTNHARWMQIAQGTAPPYQAGAPDRATAIQAIVDGVRARLDPLAIPVVTTRPAAAPYAMIVLGGTANLVGSRFGGAVNQLDCGDAVPNDVAWISDGVTPTSQVVNSVIGAIGFGVGLTATTDPMDCMCGWANQCQPNTTAMCTLGSPIVRDPAAQQRCAGAATTQDEVASVHAAFCR
jgi:hypothetical protein